MGLITFDIFGMKWFVCLVWILKHLGFVIINVIFSRFFEPLKICGVLHSSSGEFN